MGAVDIMPSYKPKVQVLLSEEYHRKFKALCEKDRRSDSVMGAIMIEKYIDDYEKENGKIEIEQTEKKITRTEAWEAQMELIHDPKKTIKEKLGESFKNGLNFGGADRK